MARPEQQVAERGVKKGRTRGVRQTAEMLGFRVVKVIRVKGKARFERRPVNVG